MDLLSTRPPPDRSEDVNDSRALFELIGKQLSQAINRPLFFLMPRPPVENSLHYYCVSDLERNTAVPTVREAQQLLCKAVAALSANMANSEGIVTFEKFQELWDCVRRQIEAYPPDCLYCCAHEILEESGVWLDQKHDPSDVTPRRLVFYELAIQMAETIAKTKSVDDADDLLKTRGNTLSSLSSVKLNRISYGLDSNWESPHLLVAKHYLLSTNYIFQNSVMPTIAEILFAFKGDLTKIPRDLRALHQAHLPFSGLGRYRATVGFLYSESEETSDEKLAASYPWLNREYMKLLSTYWSHVLVRIAATLFGHAAAQLKSSDIDLPLGEELQTYTRSIERALGYLFRFKSVEMIPHSPTKEHSDRNQRAESSQGCVVHYNSTSDSDRESGVFTIDLTNYPNEEFRVSEIFRYERFICKGGLVQNPAELLELRDPIAEFLLTEAKELNQRNVRIQVESTRNALSQLKLMDHSNAHFLRLLRSRLYSLTTCYDQAVSGTPDRGSFDDVVQECSFLVNERASLSTERNNAEDSLRDVNRDYIYPRISGIAIEWPECEKPVAPDHFKAIALKYIKELDLHQVQDVKLDYCSVIETQGYIPHISVFVLFRIVRNLCRNTEAAARENSSRPGQHFRIKIRIGIGQDSQNRSTLKITAEDNAGGFRFRPPPPSSLTYESWKGFVETLPKTRERLHMGFYLILRYVRATTGEFRWKHITEQGATSTRPSDSVTGVKITVELPLPGSTEEREC